MVKEEVKGSERKPGAFQLISGPWMDKEVWKNTKGTKDTWKMRWQRSEKQRRKNDQQKHLHGEENELRVAGCCVLETRFGIKVAGLINCLNKTI